MLKKKDIEEIVNGHLEGSALFLVRLSLGKDNLINVYIDGDKGVTINECAKLSRFLESKLDRETEDFELRVSSPGADEPFTGIRQFRKNIGRPLKVTLADGNVKKGVLNAVSDSEIILAEEIKQKNKKQTKMITGDKISISLDSITEAKVIIMF